MPVANKAQHLGYDVSYIIFNRPTDVGVKTEPKSPVKCIVRKSEITLNQMYGRTDVQEATDAWRIRWAYGFYTSGMGIET